MTTGWNKPLDHRWKFDLNSLVSELKKPPTPIDTGRLRRSFRLGSRSNFGTNVNPKGDGVTIRNENVYARIWDRGGRIPDRKPRNASFMKFFSQGKMWYLKQARGYNIQGKDYVRAAVNRWLRNDRNVKISWGKRGSIQ